MRFRARRYWRDFAAAAGGIAVGAVILAAAGWLGFARPPSVGAPSLLERAPAPPEARYGGTLVVVRPNEPQTLNPLLARDTCSLDFVSRLFNSLFTNDSDCRVVPDLVRSWTTSSDHRVWTFRLREGVRWHDGQEFTARDVVFTYRALLDPATASPRRADFTFTSGPVVVEALGRHEVRFVLPQPVPQLLSLLTVPILPEHQFAGRSPLSDPRNERPVGTGPFIFEAWEQGRYLSMRAFDDYFEGRPYIDRLEFIIEPDPARRAEMLSSGEA
ncbi:MAG: ABC transporter substrate-binding protein, partial [Bacillota bacterium]